MRATGKSSPQQTLTVAFDGRYIQDRYHGIGRYAFHLISELASCAPDVNFILVRDPRLTDSRFSYESIASRHNVAIWEVTAPLFSVKEQTAIPKLLHCARNQIYHSPYFARPWILPPDTRNIVTVHDCIFERDARYMPKSWGRAYYRLLMRFSLARSYRVAVPSAATAADVRRFYGTPQRKLVITPEAADPTFHRVLDSVQLEDARRRYGLPDTFVLAVGARRPHKNFARLVEAIAPLEEAHLVFVGEADERFRDTTREAALKLGQRVYFLGKVPEADLTLIYNLATLVASPSLVEGFGLPVLEAMACGTPVVCSDIPVFREVAGEAALYAPPENTRAWTDVLQEALRREELREHLSEKGIERAKRFTWRRAAEAILPIYERIAHTLNKEHSH